MRLILNFLSQKRGLAMRQIIDLHVASYDATFLAKKVVRPWLDRPDLLRLCNYSIYMYKCLLYLACMCSEGSLICLCIYMYIHVHMYIHTCTYIHMCVTYIHIVCLCVNYGKRVKEEVCMATPYIFILKIAFDPLHV